MCGYTLLLLISLLIESGLSDFEPKVSEIMKTSQQGASCLNDEFAGELENE